MSHPVDPQTPAISLLILDCPHCATKTAWQGNAHRPFCSARCKLIDLGAWATEGYSIPVDDPHFAQPDEHENDV